MAQLPSPCGRLREDSLSACYVFYGEETYLRGQVRPRCQEGPPGARGRAARRREVRPRGLELAEVLDVAKTAPSCFAPWRILLVDLPAARRKKAGGGG